MSSALSIPLPANASRSESWLERHPAIRATLLVLFMSAIGTVIGAIRGEKTTFLLKEQLHLSATAVGTLGIFLGIPSYLQPFVGAWTDLFPIAGFRRRSYFAIGLGVAIGSTVALAFAQPYRYLAVACLLLLHGAGGVLIGVTYNAVLVSVGNRTGTFGRLQTLIRFVPLVLGVCWTSHLGGHVAQTWSYERTYLTAATLSLLYFPLLFLMEDGRANAPSAVERATLKAEEKAKTAAALKAAAKTPGLWAMAAFVFYLIVTPGPIPIYYFTDGLHFSRQFIGDLGRWHAAGMVVGMALFALGYRRLPVIALVVGAWLMDCALYPTYFSAQSALSAEIAWAVLGCVGVIYGLCLYTLAARACPPGIEGAVFGLVMAAITLGETLGTAFGSWLYDYFGPMNPTHHFSVVHGWDWSLAFGLLFTLPAGLLIPFLPAWTRSKEPLQPISRPGDVDISESLTS